MLHLHHYIFEQKKHMNAALEIISSTQLIQQCYKKNPTPNSYHPEGGLMSIFL